MNRPRGCLVLLCVVSFLLTSQPSLSGTIGPEIESALRAAGPWDEIPVIVTLADRADLKRIRGERGQFRAEIINSLKSKATSTQKPLVAYLRGRGIAKTISLWVINGVAFAASSGVIRELAAFPGVESIRLDATVSIPEPTFGTATLPEWNVNVIRAPQLWSMGFTGNTVVVASMDTGVDLNHPDLQSRWRGGTNSWYDPNGQHATPHDSNGHGTQTMGVIVGGHAGGTTIGVAPDAKWIAIKIFNDLGIAAYSAIHQGFQWLIDPDNNANTDDAPDVVNNSWGLDNVNSCFPEFQEDIQALRASNIAVVFSAGNSGPYSSTSTSPANNPGSFAVGAVDAATTITSFSSRGPSACDGSSYPEVVAPGVNIRTTDLTFGGVFPDSYAAVSGTSFAAPHIAGALALLVSAFPGLEIEDLEHALKTSALDLGISGRDNSYGYGLIDVLAAYEHIGSSIVNTPVALNDKYIVAEDTTLSIARPGVLGNDADQDGDPLAAVLVAAPTKGTLSLNTNGRFTYTPDPNFNGTDSFAYKANDGFSDSNVATVSINVKAVNDPPIAVGDSAITSKNATVVIRVLMNDYDIDGSIAPYTVAILSQPIRGKVIKRQNGIVIYAPNKNFSGADSFTYSVRDNSGSASNIATVQVIVKKRGMDKGLPIPSLP